MVSWIRTWPDPVPPGRNYVVDQVERVVVRNYDSFPAFQRIAEGDEPGTVLTEWDIAISKEMRDAFTAYIEADPDIVHVAPYKLYEPTTGVAESDWIPSVFTDNPDAADFAISPDSFGPDEPQCTTYVAYRNPATGVITKHAESSPSGNPITTHSNWRYLRTVTPADPECSYAGLGMTYIPKLVAEKFIASDTFAAWAALGLQGNASDIIFFGWHFEHVRELVPLHWDVQPVHLHY